MTMHVRQHIKQTISAYPTLDEARRFEALAREYYHLAPSVLLRRLLLTELSRSAELSLSRPHPETVPVMPPPPRITP